MIPECSASEPTMNPDRPAQIAEAFRVGVDEVRNSSIITAKFWRARSNIPRLLAITPTWIRLVWPVMILSRNLLKLIQVSFVDDYLYSRICKLDDLGMMSIYFPKERRFGAPAPSERPHPCGASQASSLPIQPSQTL